MYIWHMPTLILQNFGAWGGFYMYHVPNLNPPYLEDWGWALYILYMQNLGPTTLRVWGHVLCFTHAQPWSCHAFTHAQTKSSKILELRACCIFYTCPTLKPPNFGVLSMWWILPWSPICESWGMLYMLHMPQPWPSNFLRLGHVLYYTHAQRRSSKFWSLGHAVYCILYMHNLKPQVSTVWRPMESWACGVYFTHAQPWSPQKF